MRNEEYYKKLDGVETKYELIYRAPFEHTVAFVKHISMFTVVLYSSIISYKLLTGQDVIEENSVITLGPAMSDGVELPIMLGLFFVINFMLLYVTFKYPLRIYKFKNK